ncbi:MAG: TRAP transporter substrate-binding protein [Verrucomicrobia bacterium]|nr:TRAP transporter substrate-binding protein [Verrucomicrobiota bacterium]MDA1069630.1 TRAP transporter substrate-binding protein [Verrucomicrobiota bacterium]
MSTRVLDTRIANSRRYCIVLVVTVLFLAGCGGGKKDGVDHVFKIANVLAESDVTGYGLNRFAEIVEQKSGGRIEIRLFHGGQLGSGVETFEAVKNGHLDLAADSFANLASITPAFEVFHLPFLFSSRAEMLAAYRSESVREQVNQELAEVGLRWFATFEIGGPRQVGTSRRKITRAADLEGLKFRASRSPLEIAAQEAWGAKGVTVDWTETPEAVRLGMVDGLTVPYASFYSARFYEGGLIRYLLDLNFQTYALVVVVNSAGWDALPIEVRSTLDEAAREAETWHVDFVGDYITKNIREMRAAGVEVNSLPASEEENLKRRTKDAVWGEFVGRRGISRVKLDLIQQEIQGVGGEGWGYETNPHSPPE